MNTDAMQEFFKMGNCFSSASDEVFSPFRGPSSHILSHWLLVKCENGDGYCFVPVYKNRGDLPYISYGDEELQATDEANVSKIPESFNNKKCATRSGSR